MSLIGVLIVIVIVAGAVAITYIALRQMGVTIPPWVVQIFWVCVVVVVAILAIKFIAGLLL